MAITIIATDNTLLLHKPLGYSNIVHGAIATQYIEQIQQLDIDVETAAELCIALACTGSYAVAVNSVLEQITAYIALASTYTPRLILFVVSHAIDCLCDT